MSDIGRGHLVQRTFEADGGIIVNNAFMADEEDLIQFRPGESSDGHCFHRGIIAIDRSLPDACMQLVVIVLLEPQPEGLVEFFEADTPLYPREETLTDGPKQPFHLTA